MALVLRSNPRRRKSSLGALFVSNPKRKKRNPVKRRKPVKRKTNARKRRTVKRRKTAKKPIVLRLNPLKMKRRKNAAHKRKKNAAHKRKKNALALKRRKNALALKRRKNGTKKGMRRKTARRAYMRRRRNAAYKRNPELALLKPVTKAMKKVPLLKQAAPYLGGSVIGMAVIVPFTMSYDYVAKKLQAATWAPQWLKKSESYAGIFAVGLGLAAITNYALKKSKLVKAQTANAAAVAIATVSGAAQFHKLYLMHKAGTLFPKSAASAEAIVEEGKKAVDGLAFMGDGGAYDVVPMAGAHMGMYGDASMVDAMHVGHDLSQKERMAASAGPERYMAIFGACPYRSSSHDGSSRYAGKMGHRWGWLIKVLGWDRFAKLCRMSAPDRIRAISQIKIAAINAAQQKFDQGASKGYSGIAMDMAGLAYESDSYSGVAMIGAAR